MDILSEPVGDGLPSSVTQARYLPARRAILGRRSQNHIIRSTGKRLAESKTPRSCQELGFPCVSQDDNVPHRYLRSSRGESLEFEGKGSSYARHHLEKDIRNTIAVTRAIQRRRAPRAPLQWNTNDVVEGRDLARSEVELPSDRAPLVRRPSLEREEAFHFANTSKGKVRVRFPVPLTEDAEVAELYQMGLLYDEEKDGADAFSLNSIQHEAPVYSIRPARRARKNDKFKNGFDSNKPLHLDLSFTDLGNDDDIAQYLMSPPTSVSMTAGDEMEHADRPGSSQSFPPLRVIYELSGSQPSFDVDTSQPPDLVTDALSDYECFSDSEMFDDTPSQREVLDDAHLGPNNASSSGPWVLLGEEGHSG